MEYKFTGIIKITSNKNEAERDSSIYGIELNEDNYFTNTFTGEIKDISFVSSQNTTLKIPIIQDNGNVCFVETSQILQISKEEVSGGGSGAIPSLQDVTAVGANTTKAISITGNEGMDYSMLGFHILSSGSNASQLYQIGEAGGADGKLVGLVFATDDGGSFLNITTGTSGHYFTDKTTNGGTGMSVDGAIIALKGTDFNSVAVNSQLSKYKNFNVTSLASNSVQFPHNMTTSGYIIDSTSILIIQAKNEQSKGFDYATIDNNFITVFYPITLSAGIALSFYVNVQLAS